VRRRVIRLAVNINEESATALEEMAAKNECSITEVVRRCIAIAKFIEDGDDTGHLRIVDDRIEATANGEDRP